MSDLYALNFDTQTLTTSTMHMANQEVHNNVGTTYEDVIHDLCRCMSAAIVSDDAQGKMSIAYALHTVLTSVLLEQ